MSPALLEYHCNLPQSVTTPRILTLLYSKDNYQILIHKELLYQTKFMREMISGIGIDSNIDVICPSVSKEELEIIVQFLYNGKLVHADETVVSKASKNLEELFGFPSLLGEVWTETVEIERDMDCNEVSFIYLLLLIFNFFFDSFGSFCSLCSLGFSSGLSSRLLKLKEVWIVMM